VTKAGNVLPAVINAEMSLLLKLSTVFIYLILCQQRARREAEVRGCKYMVFDVHWTSSTMSRDECTIN
jgi:hypothetical protein